jgi:hypothetical protein
MVHDPESAAASRPSLPEAIRERLADRFRPDVERLRAMTSREFGWKL